MQKKFKSWDQKDLDLESVVQLSNSFLLGETDFSGTQRLHAQPHKLTPVPLNWPDNWGLTEIEYISHLAECLALSMYYVSHHVAVIGTIGIICITYYDRMLLEEETVSLDNK